MAAIPNNPFFLDSSKLMRNGFVGIPSMLMAPLCLNLDELDADIAFIGMPYDLSCDVRTGTRYGPRGIREASTLNCYAFEGWYDPIRDENYLGTQWKIVDCGDIDVMHTYHEQSFANCEAAIRKIVSKGTITFILGGDHAITIPSLRAFDMYKDICVIQFDAHLDFTKCPCGISEGHGSPMRRASEMAHVGKMMQIGIRGIGSSRKSDFDDARTYGSIILTSKDVRQMGVNAVIDMIPKAKHYYITIDIDGLDPSIASGTGTPQPFGLYYEEVSGIIEGITKSGEVIGVDLVEVAPVYDPNQQTAYYASQLLLDTMSFILKEREKRAQ